MNELFGLIIVLFIVGMIFLFSVTMTDLSHDWVVIKNFFRYRLWRQGTIEIVNHDFSRDVVAVRVGEDLHLAKGTFDWSFDYLYADHEYRHIPDSFCFSPFSSLCLMIMRRVYYPQLDEAQQLIDL